MNPSAQPAKISDSEPKAGLCIMSGSLHFLFFAFWSLTKGEKISCHVCLSFKKESTKNDSDQKTKNGMNGA